MKQPQHLRWMISSGKNVILWMHNSYIHIHVHCNSLLPFIQLFRSCKPCIGYNTVVVNLMQTINARQALYIFGNSLIVTNSHNFLTYSFLFSFLPEQGLWVMWFDYCNCPTVPNNEGVTLNPFRANDWLTQLAMAPWAMFWMTKSIKDWLF